MRRRAMWAPTRRPGARARRFWLAGCAVLSLVTAGCETQGSSITPASAVPSIAVMPSGVVVATSVPSLPAPPSCDDPTASLRPPAVNPVLTAETGQPVPAGIAPILARGRLIVGLDTGSYPFSFRDPVPAKIAGFDADIASEIARDLFGDPSKVTYRIVGPGERMNNLEKHNVDIVVKTMTINCLRRERVDFSAAYFDAHQRILVVQGSPIASAADLAGKRVCTVTDSTSRDHIARAQPAATLVTVPSWADCLVMLQQHQVDAVSTDDAILAGMANQDPYLEIVGPPIADEPYGVGIAKGNPDLVRQVNFTLERIRHDGTWERIYQKWLSELSTSMAPPVPKYREPR